MRTVFDAYNMQVDRLVDFYQRINTPIIYPDGMTTSLGIIYRGRDQHLEEIEGVIPRLIENGLPRFNDVFQATKTPARAKKLSEQADIPEEILRVLKHDIELWLPKSVSLAEIDQFRTELNCSRTYAQMGLYDQLAVISAGQAPTQREQLTFQTKHEAAKTEEIVKVCDYCRTGKNLGHIRSKIYNAMGLDTWEKRVGETSQGIISRFTAYIQENHLEGKRLVPWPKEVRNGIEWAKMHLDIYAVQW